jgi:hypothetical protein
LQEQICTDQLNIGHAVKLGSAHVQKGSHEIYARSIDRDVQFSESLVCRGNNCLKVAFARDIAYMEVAAEGCSKPLKLDIISACRHH